LNYRQVLANNPIIKKLCLLQLIAYFGAWFSNVAIYTMLVQFESSSLVISAVTATHFLPGIIIAPLSGAIIDKFRIKSLILTLLFIELIMTLLFLTINSKNEIWILMILIFIRMGSASMGFSAEMSLFPKLVNGKVLQKANEAHAIIWSFANVSGMATGGIIVNWFGIKMAIVIDAIFFIIAIVLLLNIELKVNSIHIKEKISSMIKDGFLYLKNNKIVLYLILLHSSVGLTAFDALITLLAKNEYKHIIAVPLSIGITGAVRAFALMAGPLFITNRINKENLIYLFMFQGVSIVAWGLLQFNFYIALIAVFLTGFTTTTIWSYTYALLQEKIEQKFLGRVLAYNDMIYMISLIVTTFFIGAMANFIPLSCISILIGIIFFIVALYYKRLKPFI